MKVKRLFELMPGVDFDSKKHFRLSISVFAGVDDELFCHFFSQRFCQIAVYFLEPEKMPERFVALAEFLINEREIKMRVVKIRAQADGFEKICVRRLFLAELRKDDAEIVVYIGIGGIESESFLEIGDGFLIISQ